MKCPRTRTPLKKVSVGKVPVYISEACGGVLFENQTLKSFECPNDKRGKALATHLSQFHSELAVLKERVSCPLCIDTGMLRRFYRPLHAVEIDECPGCGAIWLDTGELEKGNLGIDYEALSWIESQEVSEIESIKFLNE